MWRWTCAPHANTPYDRRVSTAHLVGSVGAVVEVGDCFSQEGDTRVPAGRDSASDLVVVLAPTATTATGSEADTQSFCAAAADPARLDTVTALGPAEDSVAAGDARITCGYKSTQR